MTIKTHNALSSEVTSKLRADAEATRRRIEANPSPPELLEAQELADAAPFYFVLRDFIRQLKEARLAAHLTLADIAERTGMAQESLCRLETGAQTNPTWKTLGLFAAAVGCRPCLTAEDGHKDPEPGNNVAESASGA